MTKTSAPRGRPRPLARSAEGRFDLLRAPLVGRFLRWRWARTAMQIPPLVLAAVMIAHAFFGPQRAPKNLATLLTWVHFRGLVVLVVLLGGNFFCMTCPFVLPRELARRFVPARWKWPRALRSKWPAILLFVAVLYAYELFDLWADPYWTGVLIVSYFCAAFAIDALFARASFCKYVCPIGQFNFLASTLSPLEVGVREPAVCTSCQTKDCIRGRASHAGSSRATGSPLAIVDRGCELALFLPRKVGNLDCTFCLDCVHACPHDNVGILTRMPAAELAENGIRSGLGIIERRADFTLLTVVFTFGALLNAFAMTSPVYALEQALSRFSGITREWPILAALFCAALVIEPLVLLGGAAILTRRAAGSRDSLRTIIKTFARSLIPLGFGIWLAHYGFHLLTGALTLVPVTQNALVEIGCPWAGQPLWHLGGLPAAIVFPLELGALSLGLTGSLLVSWRLADNYAPRHRAAVLLPWAMVQGLLFAAAIWILMQPMDMRGTFLGG